MKKVDRTLGLVLFGAVWLLFGVPCLVAGLGVGYGEVRDGWLLRQRGESTRGIVLKKVRGGQGGNYGTRFGVGGRGGTSPWISFQFSTTAGQLVEDSAFMQAAAWNRLRTGGPITVVYVPTAPGVHAVEGRESLTFVVAVFSAFGVLFTAIGGTVIVLALRRRSPYRGARRRPRASLA